MPLLSQDVLQGYKNSPQDDQPLSYVRRDLSGGENNRMAGTNIADNQAIVLYNADIGTPGQTRKRPGLSLLDTLSTTASNLAAFQPAGGTNQIVATYGTNLAVSTGSTFTQKYTAFASSAHPALITNGKAGGSALGTTLLIGNPTITIATPGVVTLVAHGLTVGASLYFTTTGALPSGITANTVYYVISAGFSSGTFEIATTPGGTAINTSGSQSGTHSLYNNGTTTITIATPAVITNNNHGLIVGQPLYFTTTGALPTGITANTIYYVISSGFGTNNFEIATSSGGSAVNTSGSQSGVQSLFTQSSYGPSGDCLFIGDGIDNWKMMAQDYTMVDLGNTNTSPPIGNVAAPYGSRIWIQVKNKLYWSNPYAPDYYYAFDQTSNYYNIPIGNEKAILPIRNEGLICFGSDKVYGITPSTIPVATDISQVLWTKGCVAGRTVCQAGDDIYFMSQDGVRGLFRSAQDQLQIGASNPVSYNINNEWLSLSWAYIDGACATYFDNKIFFAVPVNSSTYNNQVWVYYPATQGWMIINGWNVSSWAKVDINGQEILYATDSTNGKVYQAWTGFNDNGTAITYQEEGKKDDLGQPLVTKWGGYLKLRAYSTGNYTLNVFANPDDQGYTQLGTITTPGAGSPLPLNLPFTLTNAGVTEQSFPLDDLGSWKTIQIKVTHSVLNTDDIFIYERNMVTFQDAYIP